MRWPWPWRNLAGQCRGQIPCDLLDCTRCGETFPTDRYTCASHLNHPLRQIDGGARQRRAWCLVASGALPLKPQAEKMLTRQSRGQDGVTPAPNPPERKKSDRLFLDFRGFVGAC
jgi:hypothetical protein